MKAYKLFKVRKDKSIGSLFINAKARLDIGVWYEAEDIPTKGYAHRPGWHATLKPVAPHLKLETTSQKREWYEIEVQDYQKFDRPESQGGTWVIANKMKIVGKVNG